jgi:hypothetical protein
VLPNKISAQSTCTDYYDGLDDSVTKLFTTERSRTSREMAFPSEVHQVQESQIERISIPQDESVCTAILTSIYKNDPVASPPTHHALYKVRDHYIMVIYNYYTDSEGNQLIEEPTVGGLFDPQFKRVGIIVM